MLCIFITGFISPAIAQSADQSEVLKPLLDVLEDEHAREKFIKALKSNQDTLADSAPSGDQKQRVSLARQLADFTRGASEDAVAIGTNFWNDLSGVSDLFRSDVRFDRSAIYNILFYLLVTVLTVLIWAWLARRYLLSMLQRFQKRFENSGTLGAALIIVVYIVVEITALVSAFFLGQIISVILAPDNTISISQTLFLNAFIISGFVVVVVRILTGIADGKYGVLKLGATRQKIVLRANSLVRVLVYGIGFVVPAIINLTTLSVGQGLRVGTYTVAAIIAVSLIRAFRQINEGNDDNHSAKLYNTLLPLVAYVYVIAAYLIALARPVLFIELVGLATFKSLIVLIVSAGALRILVSVRRIQIKVPEYMPIDREKFTGRLTFLLKPISRFIAIIVFIAAIIGLLGIWGVLDVQSWLLRSQIQLIMSGVLSGFLVLIVCGVVWALVSSWLDFQISEKMSDEDNDVRSATLYALFKNAITIAVIVFGGMIALSELGVDIGPLIAGAGVFGLALGFGAQKLVQDIISGIFIQLENAMNVGDVVELGGVVGKVEKLSLRSVALRDVRGIYHIIPFSSVDAVANYMRIFSYHVEEVGIAYKENTQDGKDALQEAFNRLTESEFKRDILGPMEMHGVIGLGESSVNLRVRIKTKPGKQFDLGRYYTELVKNVMDERGIEIPFPHTKLVLSNESIKDVSKRVISGED